MRLPTWDEVNSDEEQLNVLETPLDESLFVAGPPAAPARHLWPYGVRTLWRSGTRNRFRLLPTTACFDGLCNSPQTTTKSESTFQRCRVSSGRTTGAERTTIRRRFRRIHLHTVGSP